MFYRFTRALLIIVLVPLAVLIIFWVIQNGEVGFDQGWSMVSAQVSSFWKTLTTSPKMLINDVKFWQVVGTAVVVALFKDK